MWVLDVIVTFFSTIGKLFIAPVFHREMLWIIVPVYMNWIFTEFYQEKKGTSMGNAITNGFVPLWVGIDWLRTTINFLTAKGAKLSMVYFKALPKLSVAALMVAYGFVIVFLGIRGYKMVTLLGRIRSVSYLGIMLTPIFYGTVKPTWTVILSIIVFYPLFYWIVEGIDYLLPTPSTYVEEGKKDELFEPMRVQRTVPNRLDDTEFKV
jgi:hypothetical protein